MTIFHLEKLLEGKPMKTSANSTKELARSSIPIFPTIVYKRLKKKNP